MARLMSSPTVRIGILLRQRQIRCRVLGTHRLEDAQGHVLGQISEDTGQLEFRPRNTQPAIFAWKSVLCKAPTREVAERHMRGLPPLGEDQSWEIQTVGKTWELVGGEILDSREWWVLTPPFDDDEECHAWCHERGLSHMQLVPAVRHPPRGEIACQAAGITASGLETGALFRIMPAEPRGCRIALSNVVVGIDFHWQHLETHHLRGALEILVDREGNLAAVNELPLEAYLCSVVGSEMKAEMPHELLKVQAVCARNTYLATAGKHHLGEPFDLCNDDHCQCYRGSSRETREAREAAISTWGEVLIHGNRLCDTRYSKICGGISEAAHSVWGGPEIPYMTPIADIASTAPDRVEPPLDSEKKVRAWVDSSPGAFCNAGAHEVPRYLQYAAKYFRWKVQLTREDLERLLGRLPEVRVGEIRELVPRRRGASGRIEELAVIGADGEAVIGRELVIRQALSESTLFSACFVVDHERETDGRLRSVTLRGAGWGHGAGMCQVGATVMAIQGYTHEQILTHYFRDTQLTLLYEQPTNWAAVLDHFDDGDFSVYDRCWEASNCYEVVGCPVYERLIGPDKGYVPDAKRTKMYLDCPEYHLQSEGD
ncbi:SpoIID/LytB domain-containing protein [Candidatus Sumerlaeota bacterium]|nr:SpoIID/LytB domain-containing protein [Candidatus Sumerlaeota bacterium]